MKEGDFTKTKRISGIMLTIMMLISLLPQVMLSASAETTIFFRPSSAWRSVGGRYAVHYTTDSYDDWVDVSEASKNGYYSVSIPECVSFEFYIMRPDSTENVAENIMHCSGELHLPADITKENCLMLCEGVLDHPGGEWTLFGESSPASDTTIFFHPSSVWRSVGGRYTVNYTTDSESYDGWVTMSEASIDGYYSASIPACDSFTFCVMSPGTTANNHDNVMHCSEVLYLPTDVAVANCLMLYEDQEDYPGGQWILVEGLSAGDNTGEGGEGSEEDIANSNVLWYESEGSEGHYGDLEAVVASYSDVKIELIKDIDLSNPLVIDGQKHIDIDFCGYTVHLVGADSFAAVSNQATLNLNNTTENGMGGVTAFLSESSNALISVTDFAALNIDGGNFYSLSNIVLQIIGENSHVVIAGGSFVTETNRILMKMSAGDLHIQGGSFDAYENPEDTGIESYDLFYTRGYVSIESYNDEECDFSIRVANTEGNYINCSEKYMLCDADGNGFHFAAPDTAYVRKLYNVYIDLNNDTGENVLIGQIPAPASIQLPDGNSYPYPELKQFSHYEYNGEKYDSYDYVKVTNQGDAYFKIIWKDQVQYNVTFYANDGTDRSVTLKVWSVYRMPEEPPEGITVLENHTFRTWTTAPVGGVVTTGTEILEQDAVFYAQWICNYPENGICSCGRYEPPEISSGYYQIENIGNLYWFAEETRICNGRLTTDLDLEGREWAPFGTAAYPFRGVFDGQGHHIKNFKITAAGDNSGFIGATDDATIKNIELSGEITVTKSGLTGIGTIGNAGGSTNISKLTSHINLTMDIDNSSAVECGYSFGGLVGCTSGSVTVKECIYDGTINTEDNWIEHAGGILGSEASGGVTQISSCANYGDFVTAMTGDYDGNSYTGYGGLVGYMGNSNSKISDCIFYGDIDCAGADVKLRDFSSLGYFENATISNLYCKNSFYDANNDALIDNDGSSVSVVLGTAGADYADQCTVITEDMLKSGYVTYHLGDAWGQTIGTDSKPVLSGTKVYKYLDEYSNELKFGFAGYTADGAAVNIPTAGEYVLVFADYDGEGLNSTDIVTVTVTADNVGEITKSGGTRVTIGTGDKIMLWQDLTTLTPLCEAFTVE